MPRSYLNKKHKYSENVEPGITLFGFKCQCIYRLTRYLVKQYNAMEKFFSSDSILRQTKIEANSDKGIITISGSLLSSPSASGSASKLYQDFLLWLNEYAQNPSPRTSVEFSIFYADTPSTLFLSKVCEKLASIASKTRVHATWIYHPEDETILDLGMDLKEATALELEMVKSN